MIEFRDETDGWAAQVNRWIEMSKEEADRSLGQRILDRTKEIGITVREAANRAKITEVRFWRIVYGTRDPNAKEKAALEAALALPEGWLTGYQNAHLEWMARKQRKAAVINPAVERFFETKKEGKHMEDRAVYLGSLLFAIRDGGMLIRILKPTDDATEETETVYDGTADDIRPAAVGYDADVRVAGIRLRGDADTVGDVLEIILARG